MGKFEYLPEVIVMTFLEYVLVLFLLVKVISRYYPVFEARRWFIFELRTFDSCATSVHGDGWNKILCGSRLLSFAFFLGVGVIFKFSKKKYDTGWSVVHTYSDGCINYTLYLCIGIISPTGIYF